VARGRSPGDVGRYGRRCEQRTGDIVSDATQGLGTTTKDAGKVVTDQTDKIGREATRTGEQWKQL